VTEQYGVDNYELIGHGTKFVARELVITAHDQCSTCSTPIAHLFPPSVLY